jgi:hypothetical protein
MFSAMLSAHMGGTDVAQTQRQDELQRKRERDCVVFPWLGLWAMMSWYQSQESWKLEIEGSQRRRQGLKVGRAHSTCGRESGLEHISLCCLEQATFLVLGGFVCQERAS